MQRFGSAIDFSQLHYNREGFQLLSIEDHDINHAHQKSRPHQEKIWPLSSQIQQSSPSNRAQ
jgi:phosphoketolase